MPVATDLPWETFAAIPEAFLTAWGSLVTSLNVRKGNTLLIRGGTSSIGMAALTLAKDLGATVVATTRSPKKKEALIANGADHVAVLPRCGLPGQPPPGHTVNNVNHVSGQICQRCLRLLSGGRWCRGVDVAHFLRFCHPHPCPPPEAGEGDLAAAAGSNLRFGEYDV